MPLLLAGAMKDGRVLIVGSGGREHAISLGLAKSKSVSEIHIAPGNAGTSEVGLNHDVSADDIDSLCELAAHLNPDLVVIGPEAPLVAGLADRLREMGVPCFGPNAEGAKLEGSKQHAKRIMDSLGIPTAGSIVINHPSQIEETLQGFSNPWVIKRDGLAAGKGVTVTEDYASAMVAAREAVKMDGRVLIEEFLPGEEASILVLMDESGFSVLPTSQDHKRLNDQDEGPNTGGMGAYSPRANRHGIRHVPYCRKNHTANVRLPIEPDFTLQRLPIRRSDDRGRDAQSSGVQREARGSGDPGNPATNRIRPRRAPLGDFYGEIVRI